MHLAHGWWLPRLPMAALLTDASTPAAAKPARAGAGQSRSPEAAGRNPLLSPEVLVSSSAPLHCCPQHSPVEGPETAAPPPSPCCCGESPPRPAPLHRRPLRCPWAPPRPAKCPQPVRVRPRVSPILAGGAPAPGGALRYEAVTAAAPWRLGRGGGLTAAATFPGPRHRLLPAAALRVSARRRGFEAGRGGPSRSPPPPPPPPQGAWATSKTNCSAATAHPPLQSPANHGVDPPPPANPRRGDTHPTALLANQHTTSRAARPAHRSAGCQSRGPAPLAGWLRPLPSH